MLGISPMGGTAGVYTGCVTNGTPWLP